MATSQPINMIKAIIFRGSKTEPSWRGTEQLVRSAIPYKSNGNECRKLSRENIKRARESWRHVTSTRELVPRAQERPPRETRVWFSGQENLLVYGVAFMPLF